MLEFIKEMWLFIKTRKKIWLLPILFFLLIISFVIVAAQNSAIAPLIYTLF